MRQPGRPISSAEEALVLQQPRPVIPPRRLVRSPIERVASIPTSAAAAGSHGAVRQLVLLLVVRILQLGLFLRLGLLRGERPAAPPPPPPQGVLVLVRAEDAQGPEVPPQAAPEGAAAVAVRRRQLQVPTLPTPRFRSLGLGSRELRHLVDGIHDVKIGIEEINELVFVGMNKPNDLYVDAKVVNYLCFRWVCCGQRNGVYESLPPSDIFLMLKICGVNYVRNEQILLHGCT